MKWWKTNRLTALTSGLALSAVLWTILEFVTRGVQMSRIAPMLWRLQELGIVAGYMLFAIHSATTVEMTIVAIPVNGFIYAAIIYVALRVWRRRGASGE
jgi:hypothetical protein